MAETNKKDYYEVLGLSKNASEQEIKSTYRKLAKKYHPDVSTEENAEEKFKEISEAYSILSDKEKREKYDTFGFSVFSDQHFDARDIFKNMFGAFGDGGIDIEQLFGCKCRKKGKNVICKVNLTFNDSVYGCIKDVNYELDKKCFICNGTGGINEIKCENCNGRGIQIFQCKTPFGIQIVQSKCVNCDGKGKSYKDKCNKCNEGINKIKITKNFKFPAGLNTGKVIIVENEGNDCDNSNGEKGDLHLEITVQEHPIFKREDFDIHLDVPITFIEAIIGCEKTIPTIYGNHEIKIPKGTQCNDTITIKEKGIVKVNSENKEKGNMIITIKVIIPKNITTEQNNLINELQKTDFKNDEFDKLKKYLK